MCHATSFKSWYEALYPHVPGLNRPSPADVLPRFPGEPPSLFRFAEDERHTNQDPVVWLFVDGSQLLIRDPWQVSRNLTFEVFGPRVRFSGDQKGAANV